jgi:hypothetical protein
LYYKYDRLISSEQVFISAFFCLQVLSLVYTFVKMVNAKLEAQRQTVRHYWLNGTNSAKEIHEITNIPLCTVERKHKRGNGRKTKVTQTIARINGVGILEWEKLPCFVSRILWMDPFM